MEENVSSNLLGIGDLFKNSWEIYKKRILTWFLILIFIFITSAVLFLPLAAIFHGDFQSRVAFVSIFIAAVIASIGFIWGQLAFLTAITDQEIGIKEAFLQSRSYILSYIWLSLLMGLIIMGGYFILFIPGLIFTVWFLFAPFILITEDIGGMNALMKSKEYVRGRWLPVGWRLFLVWFLSVIISLIPIVGQFLGLLLPPFFFIYFFVLYNNLKESRGEFSFQPTTKGKVGIVATGLLGFLLIPVIMFALVGSMLFLPFLMLKQQLAGGTTESYTVKKEMSVKPSGDTMMATSNYNESDGQLLQDKSKQWTERSLAAWRLGQSKDKRAIEPLMKALKDDEQWVIRNNAAKSLGDFGAPVAVEPLIEALRTDSSVFVRESAAEALGKTGDKRAIEPLKKALNDEGVVQKKMDNRWVKVEVVAEAAAKALKTLHVSVEKPAPEPFRSVTIKETIEKPVPLPGNSVKSNPPIEASKAFTKPMVRLVKQETSGEKIVKSGTKRLKEIYIYNARGRRDPFLSIIELTKQKLERKRKTRSQSPLENYDLGDFRLIGIVFDGKDYYASVLLPDGKAYTITKGMTLGLYEGMVAEIHLDKMIVREKTFDYRGRRILNDFVLELIREEEK